MLCDNRLVLYQVLLREKNLRRVDGFVSEMLGGPFCWHMMVVHLIIGHLIIFYLVLCLSVASVIISPLSFFDRADLSPLHFFCGESS